MRTSAHVQIREFALSRSEGVLMGRTRAGGAPWIRYCTAMIYKIILNAFVVDAMEIKIAPMDPMNCIAKGQVFPQQLLLQVSWSYLELWASS